MTKSIFMPMLLGLAWLMSPLLALPVDGIDADDQVIRMRIELELDERECVVQQNPTLKVRIHNLNDFAVTLPGFTMGYIEPEIHALAADGNWFRVYYGAMDSARHEDTVAIPAGGVLEHHRFLFNGFSWERWPISPGVFQLRAQTHLSRARLNAEGSWNSVEWTCPITEMMVIPQTRRDRLGMDFLRAGITERRAVDARPDEEPSSNVFRIGLYRDFLNRYPDVAYAPEIRWNLVRLLAAEIDSQHSVLAGDAEMLDLFAECLTFCLNRGGAYSAEFLDWDLDRGKYAFTEFAMKHGRADLLKVIVKELDGEHPNDEEARLYRRVLVAGVTESIEQARTIAKTLAQRFPEGKYARHSASLLRSLERSESRAKPGGP